MNQSTPSVEQVISLVNRSQLRVTGVSDVLGFDSETVVAQTSLGRLTIKGRGLKVMGFTTETGDLNIDGNIAAIVYTESSSKGAFSKLFG